MRAVCPDQHMCDCKFPQLRGSTAALSQAGGSTDRAVRRRCGCCCCCCCCRCRCACCCPGCSAGASSCPAADCCELRAVPNGCARYGAASALPAGPNDVR